MISETKKADPALPDISVGEILILQGEFVRANKDERAPYGVRIRASKLAQLLDELIEFRRKEAQLGQGAQQAV